MRVGEAAGALSDAERELVKYVRKVVRDPRSIDGEDMTTLHAAGWSNAQIVEALTMVCLSGFTNTLALAMRFEDDLVPMGFDGYF